MAKEKIKKPMQMACNEHDEGVVVIYGKGGCPLCDAIFELGRAKDQLAESEIRAKDIRREMRI